MFDDVLQVSNVKVAEHLAQGLQECSRLQEIIQCSGISGSDSTNTVVHEFELELEQLRSKVDHSKAQVNFGLVCHCLCFYMMIKVYYSFYF